MRSFFIYWAVLSSAAWAQEKPLSDYYGFRDLEIFKVTERAGNLLAGDVNHDGLTDLVIADNTHHRIELWLQRANPNAASKTKPIKLKVNEISDADRFELKKLPVDQDLAAIALGDFNADGKTDIAYFGLPDKLIIRYQSDKGEWKDKTQHRIPDVAVAPWCLAAGDLDQNGLDDLVVLGKHETLILYQKQKGTLSPPVKLLNTSDKLGLVQVADLDGDSRHDLCYLAGDGLSRVLCCRLQSAEGTLGPEYVFDLERPRAVTLRDVDGQPGHEILTIDSRTGRLKVFQVRMRPLGDGELPERMIAYGFGKQSGGKDRDWAFGDFDGDRRTDLVVSDPGASRLILFRQQPQHGLDLGTPFPALAGIEMRQIGVRDEAKLLADYGDCGQPVCCNTHLKEMPPVSMKMAKMQKATLDPNKISGRCGRLKCCLRYEYDTYEEYRRELPPIGATVVTKQGTGKVIAQEILSKKVMIVYENQRHLPANLNDILTVVSTKGGQGSQKNRPPRDNNDAHDDN